MKNFRVYYKNERGTGCTMVESVKAIDLLEVVEMWNGMEYTVVKIVETK